MHMFYTLQLSYTYNLITEFKLKVDSDNTFFKKKVFIQFWLQQVSCCTLAFSRWGNQGLFFLPWVRACDCSGFSCYRAQALGHAGLSSCSTQAQQLWLAGPSALTQKLCCMLHGVGCSVACGIFPGPGVEPTSPALAGKFFPLSHQGSLRQCFLVLLLPKMW